MPLRPRSDPDPGLIIVDGRPQQTAQILYVCVRTAYRAGCSIRLRQSRGRKIRQQPMRAHGILAKCRSSSNLSGEIDMPE